MPNFIDLQFTMNIDFIQKLAISIMQINIKWA